MTTTLILYSILTFVALIIAGYNWMYKQEIRRTEKQIGITLPVTLLQLVNAIFVISLTIAGISVVMFFISFLSR